MTFIFTFYIHVFQYNNYVIVYNLKTGIINQLTHQRLIYIELFIDLL